MDNPQSLNLYEYALNNPTTLPDLDGHLTPLGSCCGGGQQPSDASFDEMLRELDEERLAERTQGAGKDKHPTKHKKRSKRSIKAMKRKFYKQYGKKFNAALSKAYGNDYGKIGPQTLANAPKVDATKTEAELSKMNDNMDTLIGLNRPDTSHYPSEVPLARNGTIFIAKEDWESEAPGAELEIFKTFAHETGNLLDFQINGYPGHEQTYGNHNDPSHDPDTGQQVERNMWPEQ